MGKKKVGEMKHWDYRGAERLLGYWGWDVGFLGGLWGSRRCQCVLNSFWGEKGQKGWNVAHCACAPGGAWPELKGAWQADKGAWPLDIVDVVITAARRCHDNEGAWPSAALNCACAWFAVRMLGARPEAEVPGKQSRKCCGRPWRGGGS